MRTEAEAEAPLLAALAAAAEVVAPDEDAADAAALAVLAPSEALTATETATEVVLPGQGRPHHPHSTSPAGTHQLWLLRNSLQLS